MRRLKGEPDFFPSRKDENSQYREIPKDDMDKRIYTACVRCHAHGKIASHRMTKTQWAENRNLHLGYYPTTVPQMREMDWPKESEELIEHLHKHYPFESPEWREWMKNRKDRDLSGEWKIAGYQPGLGYYEGTYTFKEDPAKGEDEYIVEKQVRYDNGMVLNMSGAGTLFSEYHLRYALAPTPLTGRIEGVFDLNAENASFTGKWWTVVQDANTFGNEQFCKADKSMIIGVFPQSLKAGSNQALALIGSRLPDNIGAADIKFSDPKVKAFKVARIDDSKITAPRERRAPARQTSPAWRPAPPERQGVNMEQLRIADNRMFNIEGHEFLFLAGDNAIFEMEPGMRELLQDPLPDGFGKEEFLSRLDGSDTEKEEILQGLIRRRAIIPADSSILRSKPKALPESGPLKADFRKSHTRSSGSSLRLTSALRT